MFAIGHIALGYLTGKASAQKLTVSLNLPLLFTVSILPDIDLLLRFIQHRGPTHSLITAFVFMTPFFIAYRKRVIPYFVALVSHSLIGDFFTGGTQLFWPISTASYGAFNINVTSFVNASAELILFVVMIAVLFKAGDFRKIVEPNNYNMVLFLPFMAVLVPMLQLGRGSESALPSLLIIPSLFWLAMFAYSVIADLRKKGRK
jgi:membrane-bound metal-dependent hydrolase YbcI (DUF457 family)